MKILCLHGVGSSGAICERQFAPFIKAADPSYDFVFVDGPVESIKGPGRAGIHHVPWGKYPIGGLTNGNDLP